MPTRMFVGGYTASSGGRGPGITVFDRDSDESQWHPTQVVQADDPTFVALTEGALHAVSETAEGRVVSFTIGAGVLEVASAAASGGSAPCHIVFDPASGALVVANYLAGTVAIMSAEPSDPARIARVLALPAGRGPVRERQDRPHAHNALPTLWGTVLVSDLGTDRIVELSVDPVALEPSIVGWSAMPSGSGPRHLAWWGERLLVTGELDGYLHVLSRADDGFAVDYSLAAYDPALSFSTGETYLSHLVVDGDLVYVAVRGRDTIATLGPAADGRLALIGEVPSGGRWPRHFAVEGGALYVANQLSDAIAVLPIEAETGLPGAAAVQIALGSPSCIVFS